MRLFLLPLSWLYQLILGVRHFIYDKKIIKPATFDLPVICVGNLSFGGTGKTPHIEYLVRLLSNDFKTAVLSRGYGRLSKGFIIAKPGMTYRDIGDESMQYFQKFKHITVAVDEKRARGIKQLIATAENPELILLDDAFQHRRVKAGLNILLTDFHNLYPNDFLFPAGRLRDITSAADRADIIIVTKTPKVFSPFTRRRLTEIIKPKAHQSLYFSYIKYDSLTPLADHTNLAIPRKTTTIMLFCGIANPYPLQDFLQKKCTDLITIDFPDHHIFSKKDMHRVVNEFKNILGKNKIMVTTEKDAMRLVDSPYFSLFKNIPLFYVPIEVKFHESEQLNYNSQVIDYVRKVTTND
ncbi:MAG: tetraacyldisaccharide 4'-kinase [Bacteroidetes bacterium]|nr:tetraacyldisaccharide 4'-kinase [Bacteroidota bacterium]MBU1580931.1 tetraacyldisaccharide 4'-kinase [Bacteroidota bacterium]MBU2559073.1 tetraacyldisaccharide 4'-kinase [Bacteroidota bacterium]